MTSYAITFQLWWRWMSRFHYFPPSKNQNRWGFVTLLFFSIKCLFPVFCLFFKFLYIAYLCCSLHFMQRHLKFIRGVWIQDVAVLATWYVSLHTFCGLFWVKETLIQFFPPSVPLTYPLGPSLDPHMFYLLCHIFLGLFRMSFVLRDLSIFLRLWGFALSWAPFISDEYKHKIKKSVKIIKKRTHRGVVWTV